MEQAALLEEESEYSYVDSEYMSDEEMLMQEFPDNPTYAQMLLEAVKSMNPKGRSRQAIIKWIDQWGSWKRFHRPIGSQQAGI